MESVYKFKIHIYLALIFCPIHFCLVAISSEEPVILSDAQAKNIGIQTEKVSKINFTETLFTLGKLDMSEEHRAVISTRVPGRVIDLKVHPGDKVSLGQTLVVIESLAPGNPPPQIALKSPLNGRVMDSHVFKGEPVDPSNHIMTISDLSEIHAVAYVPEEAISFIRMEENKSIEIHVPAAGESVFSGELRRMGSEVNPENATLEAHYILGIQNKDLLPGMRAEFYIPIQRKQNVLAIPNSAIQETTTEKFVFVKHFNLPNAFVKAPITTGIRNNSHTEIINGVFQHDEVVTKGAYALSYAGNTGISLKEALDAAHGHEHNEDGSEMTQDQRNAASTQKSDTNLSGSNQIYVTGFFFMVSLSVVLSILLIITHIKLRLTMKKNSHDGA